MERWYERSFGRDYLLVYKHRDFQRAQAEVHEMVRWLSLKPGVEVLDLCCGMGRHSMALADAGYQVTGVDLSDVLLAEARRLDPAGRMKWVKGDMRRIPLSGPFDAVVNLFTSFGYFTVRRGGTSRFCRK
ncbi:class I SAM-dependent methyltransferase [Gorillibacterium massiliense]|uniref:class I SAM-dependent methyltransferase n=1 Tax=Gorillibacterium massiliense TaxID=1280390 RepID=UPI0004AD3B77